MVPAEYLFFLTMMRESELRQQILKLTSQYFDLFLKREIVPGRDYLPASGKIFDGRELSNLVESSLDFWLTEGRFNGSFEKKLAEFFGRKYAITTNSGSSANLLAFYCLTSERLGKRAVKRGDEVIETATCFPTTLNPVIQFGCVPVFVDTVLATYNPSLRSILAAVTPRTKVIFLAHTLGNPFEVEELALFCRKRGIWLIEDCCDALGAVYKGKKVGTFGDLATLSFYPAHQITCGEGGAVITEDPLLSKIVRSFRDWGRDCWCVPGKDNTCGIRFKWQMGNLPKGYDHKYIYSHVGFNLKMTDMQAAVGLAQMDKLELFVEERRVNHQYLSERFKEFEKYFILPEATPKSEPSWFGFLLTIKDGAPFSRSELLEYLEKRKIGTRLLFGGNITKQPAYLKTNYRISGKLINCDIVMEKTFWIGCYPAINSGIVDYISGVIGEFAERYD